MHRRILMLLLPALLLAGLLPLGAAAAPEGEKFDALLKTVMSRPDGARSLGRMIGMPRGSNSSTAVTVLVKAVDGGRLRGYLDQVGGAVSSRHGEVLTVRLPYHALAGLGALDGVVRIEGSMTLLPMNDLARQAGGANVDTVVGANPQWTGKGVLVGILDTGVDTTLPAFRDPQGRTRIQYYWVQNQDDPQRHPTVRLPEGGTRSYAYGSEFTAADIQAGTLVVRDPEVHGTHVAGTAVGRDASFPGMAPEAQLMVVENNGERYGDLWLGAGTGDTLDAYEYLISRARERGLPLVVNQSQGTGMGPHDGSTLFEQAIQANIESEPRNLILCVSAGNNQSARRHARVQVPANGSATVRFQLEQFAPEADIVLQNSVDVWFRGGARPRAVLRRFTDATYGTLAASSVEIGYEQQGGFETGSEHPFVIAKELPSALNGDDRFLLTLKGEALFETSFYELELQNDTGVSSDAHLYLQRNSASAFLSQVDRFGTLGMPGTAPGAISVAAYTTRPTFVDLNGTTRHPFNATLGAIAPFSSQGPPRVPDRYTGIDLTKPDVAAPGNVIVSQLSTAALAGPEDILEGGGYLASSGTSMSTPVVAGMVALMLQERPDATAAEVKAALFQRARADQFTGALPNPTFGNGKVDAVTMNSLVASSPVLESVRREGDTLVLQGRNFAATLEVAVNGVTVPAARVDWVDQGEIRVTGVPAGDPLSTVSVLNLKAAEGERISTLSLGPAGTAASTDAGSSGCFVATAAFGSDLEPEVMTLRRFRDRHLLPNAPGRWLVGQYYRWSPPAAAVLERSPVLRAAARLALRPVVFTAAHPGLFAALAVLAAGIAWRRRRRG